MAKDTKPLPVKAFGHDLRISVLERILESEGKAESKLQAEAEAEGKSEQEIEKLLERFSSNGKFRGLSPNRLSATLDEPLGNISYHVKTLADCELLVLKKTEPRRGAVEHFYRINPEFKDRIQEQLRILG